MRPTTCAARWARKAESVGAGSNFIDLVLEDDWRATLVRSPQETKVRTNRFEVMKNSSCRLIFAKAADGCGLPAKSPED